MPYPAPVVEMFNFDEASSPCVMLAYHPDYHLGKHYNSVRYADDAAVDGGESSEGAGHKNLRTAAGAAKGMLAARIAAEELTVATEKAAEEDKAKAEKERKRQQAAAIFG